MEAGAKETGLVVGEVTKPHSPQDQVAGAPVAHTGVTDTGVTGSRKLRQQHQQQAPHSLLALIGAGTADFGSVEEVDAFIRAERQLWNS